MRARSPFVLTLAALVAALAALLMGNVKLFHFGAAAPAAIASKYAPGTRAEFAYLNKQNSNNCGLQPATVQGYSNTAHIQGSCCSAMDWGHYQEQVRDLRAYRDMSLIPHDPYDMAAGLAKQLFTYERSIHLTGAQQRVYNRAMSLTSEKGPCCCQCWRWHAFRGLARYLIVDKHFTAHQVAKVISSVDGCGGK